MNKINPRLYLLLSLIGICTYSSQSIAQVAAGDSLALVSLYSSTNGTGWTTHINWLSGNVSTWYGIKTANGRVTRINLPNNNLTGVASDSLIHLDSLHYVNVKGNSLKGFPSLIGLTLDTLDVENNKLTFSSLLPNKAVATVFTYSPQDSVGIAIDTTVVEQGMYSQSINVDNTPPVGDTYTWYLDTTLLVASGANQYTILCMDSSKAGRYSSKITNGQLPALTLFSRSTMVHISRLANPGADFAVCGSSSTLQGILPNNGSVKWSKVSGSAVIAHDTLPTTAISNLGVGANMFKYQVTANNISCAVNTYSVAIITVRRDTAPSVALAGPDQSVCRVQTNLHATLPSSGIGTWTVISGTGTVAQANSPTSAINGLSIGKNIVRWQIANGACVSPFFDEAIIYRDDTLRTVSAGRDTSICPTNYVMTTPVPTNTFWKWTMTNGTGVFSADSATTTYLTDTTVTIAVTGLHEYLNTLRYTLTNSCNATSTDLKVTVFHFTTATAGKDKEVYYTPIHPYILADSINVGRGGDSIYTYVWSPATNLDSITVAHPRFLTPDSGSYTYSVTVTDGHSCTATASVNYHVTISSVLAVPTLFTPNHDGTNDELFIPGIESYPNNELTIVDRNDQLVYHKVGYKNDWKGVNEEGFSSVGERLTPDTYYYTLKLQDGMPLQKGFFLIKY